MGSINRPYRPLPPPKDPPPRGWLGQFFCRLLTSHQDTRRKQSRHPLTGVPYIGRQCRQCGKRLL